MKSVGFCPGATTTCHGSHFSSQALCAPLPSSGFYILLLLLGVVGRGLAQQEGPELHTQHGDQAVCAMSMAGERAGLML